MALFSLAWDVKGHGSNSTREYTIDALHGCVYMPLGTGDEYNITYGIQCNTV